MVFEHDNLFYFTLHLAFTPVLKVIQKLRIVASKHLNLRSLEPHEPSDVPFPTFLITDAFLGKCGLCSQIGVFFRKRSRIREESQPE